MQKLNILGTEYEICFLKEYEDPKLSDCNGYAELYSKKIVVKEPESHPMNVENIIEFKNKVLRHEIIHAFLFESGLGYNSEWAGNEEVIDWFAIQSSKLIDAFIEMNCV
ncbi:MAG: hypothetical protein RR012_01230 [Oscillospiraceae bacterium]